MNLAFVNSYGTQDPKLRTEAHQAAAAAAAGREEREERGKAGMADRKREKRTNRAGAGATMEGGSTELARYRRQGGTKKSRVRKTSARTGSRKTNKEKRQRTRTDMEREKEKRDEKEGE